MGFTWFSLLFTMVAVAGVANAVNIIDGYNGLASVVVASRCCRWPTWAGRWATA